MILLLTVLPCGAAEKRAPTILIQQPTSSSTYSTTTAALTVGGTARDNKGVTRVTWQTDREQSGVATGTTSWSFPLTLASGTTIVTVRAVDAAGNVSTPDTLTVTLLTPPPPPGPITVQVVQVSGEGDSIQIERCTAQVDCPQMAPVVVIDWADREWIDTAVVPENDYCYRAAVVMGSTVAPYSAVVCSP